MVSRALQPLCRGLVLPELFFRRCKGIRVGGESRVAHVLCRVFVSETPQRCDGACHVPAVLLSRAANNGSGPFSLGVSPCGIAKAAVNLMQLCQNFFLLGRNGIGLLYGRGVALVAADIVQTPDERVALRAGLWGRFLGFGPVYPLRGEHSALAQPVLRRPPGCVSHKRTSVLRQNSCAILRRSHPHVILRRSRRSFPSAA